MSRTTRTAKKPIADHHLRVHPRHVDLLNLLPEFRDLSTTQLWSALPKKYRDHVPPIGSDPSGENNRMTRAVIIGMLATEAQIESHLSTLFLERTVVTEK